MWPCAIQEPLDKALPLRVLYGSSSDSDSSYEKSIYPFLAHQDSRSPSGPPPLPMVLVVIRAEPYTMRAYDLRTNRNSQAPISDPEPTNNHAINPSARESSLRRLLRLSNVRPIILRLKALLCCPISQIEQLASFTYSQFSLLSSKRQSKQIRPLKPDREDRLRRRDTRSVHVRRRSRKDRRRRPVHRPHSFR